MSDFDYAQLQAENMRLKNDLMLCKMFIQETANSESRKVMSQSIIYRDLVLQVAPEVTN